MKQFTPWSLFFFEIVILVLFIKYIGNQAIRKQKQKTQARGRATTTVWKHKIKAPLKRRPQNPSKSPNKKTELETLKNKTWN